MNYIFSDLVWNELPVKTATMTNPIDLTWETTEIGAVQNALSGF